MDKASLANVKLVPCPVSRSQARASRSISPGSVIVSVPSLASVLLGVEKGRRCDACFRLSYNGRCLKKCTGCASYYYCDTQCQSMHWQLNHKRICKIYNRMTSLPEFCNLAQHERMDILLLSHFLAQAPRVPTPDQDNFAVDDPLSIFVSLLPSPSTAQEVLGILPKSLTSQVESTQNIYARFSNNNFTIHSHMNTIGHGIFPLASRLFNHSCMPNAAPRYILTPARSVTVEIVALRGISPDEEVCIPYLDPALSQSRQQVFRYTYGFTCECTSCMTMHNLGQVPEPPSSSNDLSSIGDALRNYVGIKDTIDLALPNPSLAQLPSSLLCVLHESYMEQLSEGFSKASHEGDLDAAVISGLTLLALYLLVYPKNYPQIGLHLLELAKTWWNALVKLEAPGADGQMLKAQVQVTLSHSRGILAIYGREGDEYGPLDEVQQLEGLLIE